MGLFMIDEKKLLDKLYRWRDDAAKIKEISKSERIKHGLRIEEHLLGDLIERIECGEFEND